MMPYYAIIRHLVTMVIVFIFMNLNKKTPQIQLGVLHALNLTVNLWVLMA